MTLAAPNRRRKVGELRPSQLLYAFGVGAVVDLPYVSAMVMGLDDWDHNHARPIGEERLLAAVQAELGSQVAQLLSPPVPEPSEGATGLPPTLGLAPPIGVPVAPFPRWMLCPACRLLAPLKSDLFVLKTAPFRPDQTKYVHANCAKRPNQTVLPARFLTACERGHLDDFPWVYFVHGGPTDCPYRLRLDEFGVSGDAASIQVRCEVCGAKRRMSDAFGGKGAESLPACSGRWPHLRGYDDQPCEARSRAILLGASNAWFPITLSALSIPAEGNELDRLVDAHWAELHDVESAGEIQRFWRFGALRALVGHEPEAIWAAVQARRQAAPVGSPTARDLKSPEWRVFADPRPDRNDRDFLLRPLPPPTDFARVLQQVVLAERLREVEALTGFTRIESPGVFGGEVEVEEERRVPLARRGPAWVPATEVRGEGIFLRLREDVVVAWEDRVRLLGADRYRAARRRWQVARGIPSTTEGDGGFYRFLLLHSFSHALMRQLALECGYAVASIGERIYALPSEEENGPMAGVLLYTAAPDSEGTLGGLVRLGEPERLGRHLAEALDRARLCASDPLCAEHEPEEEATGTNWAACHACLFAPETSCERGNRYLDRSVLVETFQPTGLAFFDAGG
jgi:hypothetical protein